MKRFSFLALLPLFAACAGDKGFELPTLAVGSGGARFLDDDSTPHKAYNKAYATILKKQREIDGLGNGVGNNPSFLDVALEAILENLKIMQGLIATPAPEKMDPVIAFYSAMHDLAHRSQLKLGSFTKKKLHNMGREVPRKFSPLDVTLKLQNEGGKAVSGKKPGPPGKTAPEAITIPAPIEKEGEERIIREDGENPTPTPEPEKHPAPSSSVEYRLLYRAWTAAHANLVEAFRKKEKTTASYEEVTAALEKISRMLAPKEANSLLVYRRFYTKIHEDTAGFTRVPEGAKEEDVLNDLRIVFSGIQKEIDPAGRK